MSAAANGHDAAAAVENANNNEGTNNVSFDLALIQTSLPYPEWLEQELRSNHAGETGAVEIYNGAIWALDLRAKLLPPMFATVTEDAELRAFAEEHKASEQHHMDLLEEILPAEQHSKLLPAWRLAGRGLGAVSTVWCTRGMYVTTAAVEEFVESHYNHQIDRLATDARHASDPPSMELKQLLQHCCEDEVHHKEEAAERAAKGPLPWFDWVDGAWQWLVMSGSAAAAAAARRV